VTAPFGPFSRRLASELREAGAVCERILFNGGDLSEWGFSHARAYRGCHSDWPAWIEAHLKERGVTDLITHGDINAYGAAAIRAASKLGLRVHVFEQGYFRPHWVTLERDGVNANSPLSRRAQDYRQITPAAHRPPPVAVGRITPAAVMRISSYHLWVYLGWMLFPRYRAPYHYPAILQAWGHARRYIRQRLFKRSEAAQLTAAVSGDAPLFLALLQRPGDSQLTRHSAFATSEDVIRTIMKSFAAHADASARLLFKIHPLDHGLEAQGGTVRQVARELGLEDRVFCTEIGHLPTLLKRVAGVVSVNSTAGISGLEAGVPTIALGRALYDLEGLTHQTGLDAFWVAPQRPDPELYNAFSAAVIASAQINGAFSTRHGIELIVPEAARRLTAAR
jgi:capsular polysaccharide export protein